MIWETLIVCVTVIILLRGYLLEKIRRMEIENDKLDHDNLTE